MKFIYWGGESEYLKTQQVVVPALDATTAVRHLPNLAVSIELCRGGIFSQCSFQKCFHSATAESLQP